ncbi:6-phosphogluconolactonase [Pontibacter ummariensis]|uniref:6-phosphogluconolactonase n=2 Tax=Pontibacter ummariensis TaxID=1610492 RepID=A0A239HPW1_9BACT|nr:6-phosphogluconolactonase [Pontibacter ummariensis]SNS82983.1 6-phosphogluconolactonase [Pontibacter ummariensis]
MRPNNSKSHPLVKAAAFGLASLSLAFSACTSTGTENAADAVTSESEEQNLATSMVYVGTYADPEAESIFLYRLNPETGELTRESATKGGPNPSFLALDEERRYLYAVNEIGDYQGQNSGAVSAFAVDPQTGALTLLNRVPSKGGSPAHTTVDGENKTVLVANYMGGNVAAFPIQENGQLGEASSVQQHEGAGPNKQRQEAPHAHYIAPDPQNKYVLAVDLGTDKVYSYRLNPDKAELTPNDPAVAYTTEPGAGPRHLTFHPNGRYAYLINELNSTMVALAYDADKGTFTEIETVPTIPADFKENNQTAEVKVSADGKYLYGSNRGHNSIVVYAIDENTGKLTQVQLVSTGGDWPRDFSIDPTGNILMVANERSNNITTFKIDKATGKLTPTGYEAEVHKPVNVQVVPAFQ